MKILITTDWYEPVVNGVVVSVLNLRSQLQERGHEVRILTLANGHRSHTEDGVTYAASLGFGRIYPNARVRLSPFHKCLKEIMEWKPDIIHSQCEFSTFVLARYLARKLDIPVVHTYHTVYEDYTHYFCPSRRVGHMLAAGLSRFVLKKTDLVVVPSQKVADLLESYRVETPTEVVPTGIELSNFEDPGEDWVREKKRELGIPEGSFVLLYIGRLAKEKNLQEILGWLADLKQENICLLIVGDGPYRGELEEEIDRAGIRNHVHFAGMVPKSEVGKYYHLGDLFVNASTSETQGLTYFEALSAGLPTLCRKDPCLDGVITNGYNGWQYDKPEEFFDSLLRFYADPAMQERMGKNALEVAAGYSAGSFAGKIEELYLQEISLDLE